MPRTSGSAVDADKPDESENLAESEEGVDLDGDNEAEETMEEEVEYEEVEEEEEVEEIEEEEEVEEEVEEEEEIEEGANEADEQKHSDNEDDKQKHAELLALPPHGSEVYLGGLPHDATEEDLKRFCESIGEVTEVRIMKGKDSGEAKGYAFVTFRSKELASKAIEELNNTELKGKKIRCSTSQANHRLFIGNVPRSWEEEDMKKVVQKIGPGVISVELLKVKAVYVKNLPKDITQDRLRQLFERHGKVTKVVLPPAKAGHEKSRFGFVHFAERSSAMKALKNTEKYEIDGQVLDCSLAKPQADQKSSGGPNSQKSVLHPTFPPRLGYGVVEGTYGALGGYGAAGFAQPMIYGRGPTPTGMAMMPMLLPDGRIGYVLQQPGMQQHTPPPQPRTGRGGGAGSSSGGRRSNESGRGRSRVLSTY
ncbi:heterogeneous nuclear ribonucleoprotein Q isoform X3 [Jatropha curcas]|uniref:heterogeneous nuclear ribonucleoprotein Q isoform X3 n=1 Tax=Jatropha curcas TaxID=180498 RepID=UPI001893F10B|nr:heterogeneous nuclear ribonucleoprotein Q isoform X3 [Jatropha curcas]